MQSREGAKSSYLVLSLLCHLAPLRYNLRELKTIKTCESLWCFKRLFLLPQSVSLFKPLFNSIDPQTVNYPSDYSTRVNPTSRSGRQNSYSMYRDY